ncbi:MAG: 3-oxoacyl-ACP synthase [Flavobacteriales bacterium]
MEIKGRLLQACKDFAQEKLTAIQNTLSELSDSVGSDSKSTAGDKHETGRAMLHLEQEKAGEQLQQAQDTLRAIDKISIQKASLKIAAGSLVKTNRGSFFIAISAGKITVDKLDYYAISPKAPIAQKLIGLAKNEKFKFNGVEYVVEQIL